MARTNPAWGANARSLTSTFTKVNELTAFTGTQNSVSVSASITYSPNGELIDDGVRFTYKYDAWGRMVSVSTRGGEVVPAGKRWRAGHRRGRSLILAGLQQQVAANRGISGAGEFREFVGQRRGNAAEGGYHPPHGGRQWLGRSELHRLGRDARA